MVDFLDSSPWLDISYLFRDTMEYFLEMGVYDVGVGSQSCRGFQVASRRRCFVRLGPSTTAGAYVALQGTHNKGHYQLAFW